MAALSLQMPMGGVMLQLQEAVFTWTFQCAALNILHIACPVALHSGPLSGTVPTGEQTMLYHIPHVPPVTESSLEAALYLGYAVSVPTGCPS